MYMFKLFSICFI